jgi:uncharacterized protein (TIGR03643 family)
VIKDDIIQRIIEMAWEDRTPFEAIRAQFGFSESEVIVIMRRQLSPKGWRRWRKRVSGRVTKHASKRPGKILRFKSSRQRAISLNRISVVGIWSLGSLSMLL